MRLKCNLCEKYVTDRHIYKTDELWLRTIRGRDYLVCKYHRGRLYEKPNSGRDSEGVQKVKR